MIITAYTGETVPLETVMTDEQGDALDLTGATAIFAWEDADGTHTKDCTITDNVLSVELTTAETLTAGRVPYEMRVKLNGKTRSVDAGSIYLYDRLLKEI